MSFDSLGLSAGLLKAVAEKGYRDPSPIQQKAIPAVLDGRDLLAAAQTGTGKTAAFTLPLLQRLSAGEPARGHAVRALVLTPTRELAAQVESNVRSYGKNLPLRTATVFGGVGFQPQIKALRKGVDVLVATPGRLLDLLQQKALHFRQLETLVLDEADRMLDMGFIHDIRKIMSQLPEARQTLLFSATFSPEIRQLAADLVKKPVEIDVSPRNSAAETVHQQIVPADKKSKPALLAQLINDRGWFQVLVFTRTKHGANKLTNYLLDQKIQAAAIHGNKSQAARTQALKGFKSGRIGVLVATDIAARGIDIQQLPQVVNFDLPNVPEDYVHRIGRTGRAGAQGQAWSLVAADEVDALRRIEKMLGRVLKRTEVPGFAPEHALPTGRAPAPKAQQRRRRGGPGRKPSGRHQRRAA